jgi:uncharacterized protein YbjT (DUF2867 family)
MTDAPLVLLTGATGYVGGRLAPRLLEAGYRVRCLVRDARRLQGRAWMKRVELVEGDALQPETLGPALRGVAAAYYLIHGARGGRVDAEHDLRMARNFAAAAEAAGVERILYLGELVDTTAQLSPYLRARHETGAILRYGGVPVTEFRAGMIVGAGSILFEMIRYLVEREPVLVCPAWFFSTAQPIAIRNVLEYLIAALRVPESAGKMIEIGGPERLTYADMLMEYARERGLKRWLVRLPVYLPRLSAYWVHMVTPIHWRAVLPLIEGLRLRLVVRDAAARGLFPDIRPMDFRNAVHLALGRIQRDNVETAWSDALVAGPAGSVEPYRFTVEEGLMVERRQVLVEAPPEVTHRAYTGIGGTRGWLYLDRLWAMRGWLDKAVGGVGIRRGRRHPDELRPGEALDFWRVEEVQPERLLRLRAEMKLPGTGWLQFVSEPRQPGRTLLTVTAYFAPRGLWGFLYWYAMWPFHKFIFDGLTRRVASRARLLGRSAST